MNKLQNLADNLNELMAEHNHYEYVNETGHLNEQGKQYKATLLNQIVAIERDIQFETERDDIEADIRYDQRKDEPNYH